MIDYGVGVLLYLSCVVNDIYSSPSSVEVVEESINFGVHDGENVCDVDIFKRHARILVVHDGGARPEMRRDGLKTLISNLLHLVII